MKRSIEIEGTGKILELSKVGEIDTRLEMINLEKLSDGTWRLIYTKNLIPNIEFVEGFKIIRED